MNTTTGTTDQGRPQATSVNPHNVPQELKSKRQWVTWKYELRDGKWTKPPFQANGKARASTTDPSTWASFNAVFACWERGRVDGIGFVFKEGDGLVGIDLDKCDRDDWVSANEILLAVNSYSEFSPSGRGAHIFAKATIQGSGRKGVPSRCTPPGVFSL